MFLANKAVPTSRLRGATAGIVALAFATVPAAASSQSVQDLARRAGAEFAPWYVGGSWTLRTSLYTRHFSPDPAHVNNQQLVNVEYLTRRRWLGGFANFSNSFGQPTQYLYAGYQWNPWPSLPSTYVKLTGGILHGYKDQYKDKIPLNRYHYAPAILPSIGFQYGRASSELVLFGTAGLMFTIGWKVD